MLKDTEIKNGFRRFCAAVLRFFAPLLDFWQNKNQKTASRGWHLPADAVEAVHRRMGLKPEPLKTSACNRPEPDPRLSPGANPGEFRKPVPAPRILPPEMPPLDPLPCDYGVNRIVVLMRDPGCLFTYWELPEKNYAAALTLLGEEAASARLVLRVFSRTAPDETETINDIPVQNPVGNYYLPIHAGGMYRIHLGLHWGADGFLLLASSNDLITPGGSHPLHGGAAGNGKTALAARETGGISSWKL